MSYNQRHQSWVITNQSQWAGQARRWAEPGSYWCIIANICMFWLENAYSGKCACAVTEFAFALLLNNAIFLHLLAKGLQNYIEMKCFIDEYVGQNPSPTACHWDSSHYHIWGNICLMVVSVVMPFPAHRDSCRDNITAFWATCSDRQSHWTKPLSLQTCYHMQVCKQCDDSWRTNSFFEKNSAFSFCTMYI